MSDRNKTNCPLCDKRALGGCECDIPFAYIKRVNELAAKVTRLTSRGFQDLHHENESLKAENTRLQLIIKGDIEELEHADAMITRLKLAVQLPTARTTDIETSHEAAKDARFGQTMRQLNVLLTLHKTQWAGLTDFELAERTGTQQNSTGKRRLECQRAGLVEPFIMGGNKVKRPSRAGGKSMAQVWRLTEYGEGFIVRWMEWNDG